MSSIQQRPNGKWRVRFRDPAGVWRARHFDRRSDAERWVAAQETDVDRGQYVDWRAGRITFGKYAEQWLEHQVQHRPKTRAMTASRLRVHILPFFDRRPLAAVTRSEVKSWVAERSEHLAPATLEVVYRLLAQVFLSAVDDRMILLTPCRKIPLPERPPPAQLVPFTVQQVQAVAEALPARYRVAVWLGANAGLRVGETLGVTKDRIDFLRRSLRVDRQLYGVKAGVPVFAPPKTKASIATLPIAQSTLDRMAAHLAEFGVGVADLMICRPDGRPLSDQLFHEAWATAVTEAELPEGARFHELRHVYASALIRKGLSPKAVQVRMRHATMAETFDTYGHLWPDDEERTRQAIDEVFAVPDQSLVEGTGAGGSGVEPS